MHDVRSFLGAPAVDLPVDGGVSHGEAAKTLFAAENCLRSRVATWLAEVDQTWWPSRVPESLVGEAELRRRVEMDSPAAPPQEQHPILYLTLRELVDVILMRSNWDEVFRVQFGISREAFERAVADVTVVRNKVAHSRVVRESDLEVLTSGLARLGLSELDT